MLTDDDLTAELEAAFRSTTTGLTYTGRRRPRRTTVVVMPLAAAASIAVAAVAIGVNLPDDQAPSIASRGATQPSARASAMPKLVTDSIKLAGFTISYRHQQGQPAPLHAVMRATLPEGVTEVPLTGTEARAWIGKDPKTGDNALYVKAPTRNDNRLFALLSSQWSQEQLIDLFKHGSPTTVPMVED